MPATDALQPPLTAEERAVCKSYGGWTGFTQSMGLKAWDSNDAAEGKAILESFVANDSGNKTTNNGGK